LTIQCDEMWSFVGNKGNKQWIWLALDVDTREVVGVHVGDRSEQGARALWASLPDVYRQCAGASRIFGMPMPLSFLKIVTRLLARRQVKPHTDGIYCPQI
jgi:IS1 transposase